MATVVYTPPEAPSGYTLVNKQITVQSLARPVKDLDDLRRAIEAAELYRYGSRHQLVGIYERIRLDAFVASAMKKRTDALQNRRLRYVGPDGKEDEAAQRLLSQPWASDLVKHILSAVFWGPTLIEPRLKGKQIVGMDIVPRQHVEPFSGHIGINHLGIHGSGLPYRTTAPYNVSLLEVGQPTDLGELANAAIPALLKISAQGDWANFAQIFGMPTRIYKYNPLDPNARAEAEQQAKTQGSAAYIIMPEGVSIEFAQGATAANVDVFDRFIQSLNESITISLLGNTLTTTVGSSGSLALGAEHANQQLMTHLADMRFVEGVLNHTALDFLAYWGFPLREGYTFALDRSESFSLKERLEMDIKLAKQVPIDDGYFYENYGIPRPKAPKAPAPNAARPAQAPPQSQPSPLFGLYAARQAACPACGGHHGGEAAASPDAFAMAAPGSGDEDPPAAVFSAFWRMARSLFRAAPGELPTTWQQLASALAGWLWAGTDQAWPQKAGIALDIDPLRVRNALRLNIHWFSAAKALAQLQELRDALTNPDGSARSFKEFRAIATRINEAHNATWLRTEYDTAIASGQAAGKWWELQATAATYGYLRYVTAGDSLVREEHRILNGTVLPIGDAFWQAHFPPLGWNCRCTVRRVLTEDVTSGRITPDSSASATLIADRLTDPYFRGNVGTDGQAFRIAHPYFARLTATEQDAARQWLASALPQDPDTATDPATDPDA